MDLGKELALDIDLEEARALHRVWRALNDGDCPKCHKHHPATSMIRNYVSTNPPGSNKPFKPFVDPPTRSTQGCIQCPSCGFLIYGDEIEEIERLFAPAMDGAMKVFENWRKVRDVRPS